MNLVLLEASEIVAGSVRLEGARAEHIRNVLALAVGQRLRVGVVDGPVGTARVAALDPESVRLDGLELDATPAPPRVDLVLALPRPKVLARLLSPIAQLGARRIFLTGAWKVERFYFDAHILRPDELRAQLLEGLAQVKDTRLPVVTVHRSLAFLLDEELDAAIPADAQRIVLDARGEVLERAVRPGSTLLAIGPEAGLTAREDALFAAKGFQRASLGPRTLRSDVAVLAALARVHASS